MNKTTFAVALLVAATMVFSSALPVMSNQGEPMIMNEMNPRNAITTTLSDPTGTPVSSASILNAPVQQPKPLDIWDQSFYYDVGGDSGSLYLVGLGFDGEYFYCPEFASGTIHKFEVDGTYIGSFTISGVSNIIDLAYDGEYFYGAPQSPSNNIYVMDFENEVLVDTITAPAAAWNIAYDPDADDGNGGLWIGQWAIHITLIDMSGTQLDTIPVPESCLGFAYDNTFEYTGYNGPFLWIFTGTSAYPSTPAIIKCIDIDTKTLIPDFEHDVTLDFEGGIAGGLEIDYLWDSSKSTLIGLVQGTVNDYAFGYEISSLVPLEHDVGVKKLLLPEDGPATEFMTPEVLVKNYGNNTEYPVDVQFEIIKCEAGPPLLGPENFSGTFPPTGWTTDIWTKVGIPGEAGNAGGEAPEAQAYKYDYIPGEYYYNYIMSPQVNCTGFEKVNVKFHFAMDVYYDNYVYFYLKYRQNSTSPWKDLSPWTNPIPEDIEATYYEIGCYGWGQDIGDEFQLKFEMTSYYYGYNYVWLDDVKIEGCAGCAEYAQLTEDENIPVGEEVVVDFSPAWTPSEWHNPDFQDTWEEYPLSAYTILDTDENSRNDEKHRLLSLYYPWNHDVGAMSLEGPESGPAQTFPIEATIKNVGQYDECCFTTYATVQELAAPDLFLTEDFAPYTVFPPTGWTRTNTLWRGYSGNYCGGGGQEAQFYYYPSQTGDFRLYTPPIDTRGYGKMSIQFLQYLSHYTTPYTIKVETSQDAISWTTIWEISPTSSIPAELVELETTANVDVETTYVSWTFSGYSWNTNWWNIDNVEIGGVVAVAAEYTDSYCVSEIEDGEELQIVFDDWTPDFFSEGLPGTKTYIVKVETELLDPPDNNLANDAFTIEVELKFFHDVGIQQVSSPYNDKSDRRFYAVNAGTNTFVWFDPDTPSAYNNIGSFPSANFPQGATFVDDVEWVCDTTGQIWTKQADSPDTELVGSTGTGACNALAYHGKSKTMYGCSSDQLYEIDMDNGHATVIGSFGSGGLMISMACDKDGTMYGYDLAFDASNTYTIDLDTGHATILGSCGVSLNFGQDMAYDFEEEKMYACAYNYGTYQPEYHEINLDTGHFTYITTLPGQTTCFAIPGGGFGTEVYITPGNQDIIAIAENIGTFPETDMTCSADIYEYITNCSEGTLVYSDNITGIDIEEPLTGTETLTFDDYLFATEGVYALFLELVDDNDGNLKNNAMTYGIGCDGTVPSSTHGLDPPTPDGLNGYYVSDVDVTLDAIDPSIGCEVDGSGVKEIKYQVDDGPVETLLGEHGVFTIHTDSILHTIKYWAIDNVGNTESQNTFTLKMDQTLPNVAARWDAYQVDGVWHVLFSVNASDVTSGMDKVKMYINEGFHKEVVGGGPVYEFDIVWSPDFATVDFRFEAWDIAGLDDSVIIPGDIIIKVPYLKSENLVKQKTQPLPK